MKFRKGDVVSITGAIKYDQDGDDRIFVSVEGHDLWVEPGILTLVQARFDVGDSVRFKIGTDEDYVYGVIWAISDGHAWIDWQNGDYCTRLLTSIEHVPGRGRYSVKQREPRLYDAGYLAWLRTQRCVCCGRHPPVEAAHIRIGLFAKGMKPHDKHAVSMCSWCHREGPEAQHNMNEEQFWRQWQMDPFEIAARLYATYGGKGGKPKKRTTIKPRLPKEQRTKIQTRKTEWPRRTLSRR